jgi:TonB family protein
MRRLIFLAIVLSSHALSLTLRSGIAAAQQLSSPSPTSITLPATLGAPHVCNASKYPGSALQSGAEGTVTIVFSIEPDGTTKDAVVTDSSGTAALDQRALDCVATWQYRPAMRDGHPIEVPWVNVITFSLHVPGPPIALVGRPVAIGKAHICLTKDYPPEAIPSCAEGIAKLSYHIEPDGTIKDLVVTESTGNASLDQASIKCASGWQYAPESQDEKQMEFAWQAKIVWHPPPGTCTSNSTTSSTPPHNPTGSP